MAIVKWKELPLVPDQNPAAGLDAMIQSGKSMICTLAQANPAYVSLGPLGTYPFLGGAGERLCGQPTPSPPPGPLGNCGVTYRYRIKVQNAFSTGPEPNATYEFGIYSWGTPSITPGTDGVDYIGIGSDGSQQPGYSNYGTFISWKGEYGGANIYERVPDTSCAPGYYPPNPSYPNDEAPPLALVNVVIPVQVSPQLIVPLTFVYVRPSLDIDFNAPVSIDFRPTIQIPELNLELHFDIDGVEINNYGGGNSPTPTPSPDPRPDPPRPSKPNPSQQTDLSKVYEKLNKLQECNPCPDTFTYGQASLSGNSFIIPISSDSEPLGFDLQVVSYPSNVKNQWGGGNAPDVLYLGWFAFTRNGIPGVRTPISYEFTSVPMPTGCDGVAVTLYQGCSGVGTVSYRFRHPPE